MVSTRSSSPSSSYSSSPSPTSTSRTSPPPTSQAISPSYTAKKDHLTILPPELLLAIISHLPSSSSLLPLSQTNIYLQTFLLNTHAATICNIFITTRHSHAASILSATYRDGWLLPNHEAVLGTEKRITREQIRQAGCGCADCRAFLQSSRSTTASSSELSLASNSSTQGCLKLPCFPNPPTQPSQTPTVCRAQHLFDTPWKLSMPGPMFLVFLERYEWEIETRFVMLEAECKDANESKREEEVRRFSFIVGNYSVRRFLENVERGFEYDLTSEQPAPGNGERKKGVGRRFGGSLKKSWARGRRIFKLKNNKKGGENQTIVRNSTPPLFGEIEKPASDTSTTQKHDRSWMTGLLWYYGLQAPSLPLESISSSEPKFTTSPTQTQTSNKPDSSAETAPEAQPPQPSQPGSTDAEHDEKSGKQQGSNKKARNCMGGVKIGLEHVGSKMKQVFRRCKFVGGFQTLDG